MKNALDKVGKINNELYEIRMDRINTLTLEIKLWDPDKDDIKKLVLMLEELGSLQERLGLREFNVLECIKSSFLYEEIKIVKQFMNKTGEGDVLICDKNGFCICDFNDCNPIDLASDNNMIIIEHIDNLIEDVAAAEEKRDYLERFL